MRCVGVIPARLESSRLPGKLLLAESGWPLIRHTWESARRAERIDELIVATDSPRIAATVRAFGGRAEMTGEHPSGTDRVAEVVRRHCPNADLVVNVQGDEPELDPATIDAVVETLLADPTSAMSTLATPIRSAADRDDPSCVKVVRAGDGRALYFSRATIPHVRDADDAVDEDSPHLLHIGLYAYRRDFLLELTTLPPSPLERLEKLEQLRALEAGATIRVALTDHRAVGIDTRDDYDRFIARSRAA